MRCLHWLVFAAILAAGLTGPVFAQDRQAKDTAKNQDAEAKNLMAKYEALPEKARLGADGSKIIDQLKAMAGLSPATAVAVAQLQVRHNLGQIALAAQGFKDAQDKPKKAAPIGPNNFGDLILPFVPRTPSATKWEYKVISEADVRKLGKGDVTAGLNQLGADRWELVAPRETQFYFKRPVVKLLQLQIPDDDLGGNYYVPREEKIDVPQADKKLDLPGAPDDLPTLPDPKKAKKFGLNKIDGDLKSPVLAPSTNIEKVALEAKKKAEATLLQLQTENAVCRARTLKNAVQAYLLRNRDQMPANWDVMKAGDRAVFEKDAIVTDPWGNLYQMERLESGEVRVFSKGPPGGKAISSP